MVLINDRQITISAGLSRKDVNWKQQTMSISELYEKLGKVVRSPETLAEYFKMPKSQQDERKDIGGFVGGAMNSPRRKLESVISHDLITLDFDDIPPWQTDAVTAKLDECGCGYCVYSTRKHMPNKPRLRVIVPLDRSVTPDEYEPVARRMADYIGIAMIDPTTFDNNRLMYWPSCCADSEFVYKYADAPLAKADILLSTYADWKDFNAWPQKPGALNYQRMAQTQGEPTAKPGLVGLFCRTYDINRALDELLPDVYVPTADPNRLTYAGGSTTGGAVVYQNGKFLYSHHATDPCSNRLVNAFDLVRLHKFGAEDDTADPATPTNRLPSYAAMTQYALNLDAVKLTQAQEQMNQIQADFGELGKNGVTAAASADDSIKNESDAGWMLQLKRGTKGEILNTIENALIVLENDAQLKGKFAHNDFAGRGEVLGQPLPWSAKSTETRRLWSDSDLSGLYWYLEKYYGLTANKKIDNALDIHAKRHAFNDVQTYLKGLHWDKVPRLDTLFVDYLGANNTPYVRTVTRKAFTAAVARAMTPGCKYDNMLILCGPQGIGKSTILDKMSRGFFNDSIRTFAGKDASELLPGVWIVEIAELDAFKKSDVSSIKQFLSLRADRYRAAYGRYVKELPRCCVFFGTCNEYDFLTDTTGNRRFWPVDVGRVEATKNVFTDLNDNEIDQLWAEAKARWQMGETLYLPPEMESAAREAQEAHREMDVMEGVVTEWLDKPIPDDWDAWPLDKRLIYWAGGTPTEGLNLVKRQKVCALEVWCELYRKTIDLDMRSSRAIRAILTVLPGWEKQDGTTRVGQYGPQRTFARKECLSPKPC